MRLTPLVVLMSSLLFTGTAHAQDAPTPQEPPPPQETPPPPTVPAVAPAPPKPVPNQELMVGGRIVGEVWEDSSLSLVYRANRAAATGTAITPVFGPIEVAVEAGYVSMSAQTVESSSMAEGSETVRFQLIPLSLLVGYRLERPAFDLAVGVGPALTVWNEITPDSAIAGNKLGFAMTTAVRIPTRFVPPPPVHHAAQAGPRRVDLELSIGRRQHQAFGLGSGLNLSAWRAGVGLLARF